MIDLRTAAQQALEALESAVEYDYHGTPLTETHAGFNDAATALRAALAELVQEPAAIVGTQEDVWKGYGGQWAPPGSPIKTVHMLRELPVGTLLYTAPPKPLTEEEIIDLWAGVSDPESPDISMIDFARAIERAHGIGGKDE